LGYIIYRPLKQLETFHVESISPHMPGVHPRGYHPGLLEA
jgi:hypothetical protein